MVIYSTEPETSEAKIIEIDINSLSDELDNEMLTLMDDKNGADVSTRKPSPDKESLCPLANITDHVNPDISSVTIAIDDDTPESLASKHSSKADTSDDDDLKSTVTDVKKRRSNSSVDDLHSVKHQKRESSPEIYRTPTKPLPNSDEGSDIINFVQWSYLHYTSMHKSIEYIPYFYIRIHSIQLYLTNCRVSLHYFVHIHLLSHILIRLIIELI